MLVPHSMAPGRSKSFGEQVNNSKSAGVSGGFGAYSNTVVSTNVLSGPYSKIIGKSTFVLFMFKMFLLSNNRMET